MVSVVRRGSKLRQKRSNKLSDEPEHHSVSVRKIDNGFIVRTSKSGPSGYNSSEAYHPKKPNIDIQSIPHLAPKSDKAPSSVAALRKATGPKVRTT